MFRGFRINIGMRFFQAPQHQTVGIFTPSQVFLTSTAFKWDFFTISCEKETSIVPAHPLFT